MTLAPFDMLTMLTSLTHKPFSCLDGQVSREALIQFSCDPVCVTRFVISPIVTLPAAKQQYRVWLGGSWWWVGGSTHFVVTPNPRSGRVWL